MSVFYLAGFEIQSIEKRKQPYYPHLHHNSYEIRLVIYGEENFSCPRTRRNEREKVVAGDIVIIHPDEPHHGSFISCNHSEYRLYYISDEYLSSITGVQPYFGNLVIKDKELFDRLLEIHQILENSSLTLNRAVSQCNSSDRFADIKKVCRKEIQSARYDLGTALRDLVSKYSSSAIQPVSFEVERMKKYISEPCKYSENLDEIAQNLNISPSKLSHQFKAEVNISPDLYRRMLQLERSKLLLANGTKVLNVPNLVGFNNLSHFSSRFKHYFGLKPLHYKNCFVNENL
jgi:AraC-like DNA-binding protein